MAEGLLGMLGQGAQTIQKSVGSMREVMLGLPVAPVNPMNKSGPDNVIEVGMKNVGVPVFDDRIETHSLRIPRQFLTLRQIDSLFSASDVAQTILRTIEDEMFRNGFGIDELFEYKCESCGKEFHDEIYYCDECLGRIKTPQWTQRKLLMKWLPAFQNHNIINRYNQNLKQVCKQTERDLNKFDNGFIFLQKGYLFTAQRQCINPQCSTPQAVGDTCDVCGDDIYEEGMLISSPVKEVYRASPYWMRKIYSTHGLSRNLSGEWAYVCVNHRRLVYYKELEGTYRCPKCEREMFLAEFGARDHNTEEDETYYIRGEVYHLMKYEPNPGYGVSRMYVLWVKLLTLYQMDKYIWKMFSLQRSPRGLLFLRGRPEVVQSSWMWMRNMAMQNPNMIWPVAVDQAIGDKANNIAQYVDLAIDFGLMQFIETRKEFRITMGMVYGVEPVFQGDLSTGGGLNNEGLQVTVTNRAMQEGQSVWNDFFKWFSHQVGASDLSIIVNPSEEKDLDAQIKREGGRLDNAKKSQDLGYEIDLKMGDDGLDFKIGEKNPELRAGAMGGMGGFPMGGGGFPSGNTAGMQGNPSGNGGTQAYMQGFQGGPELTKELKKSAEPAPRMSHAYGQQFEPDPTDDQKKTGKYKKPKIKYNGETIIVENPVGSIRQGQDKGGKKWKTRMRADYGYILGLIGADKDHLDVFVKPLMSDSDQEHVKIFIIDQVNPTSGQFDEHKVMFGYESEDDAIMGYLSNYESGWEGLGAVTELTLDLWNKWKKKRGATKKPAEGSGFAKQEPEELDELFKGKNYVSSEAAAPPGVTLQTGPRGGTYYEGSGRQTPAPPQEERPIPLEAPEPATNTGFDKLKESLIRGGITKPTDLIFSDKPRFFSFFKDMSPEDQITAKLNAYTTLKSMGKEDFVAALKTFKTSWTLDVPSDEIQKNKQIAWFLGALGSDIRYANRAKGMGVPGAVEFDKEGFIEEVRNDLDNDTKLINSVLKYMGFKDRVKKSGLRNTPQTKTAQEIADSLQSAEVNGITYKISPTYVKNSGVFKNQAQLEESFKEVVDSLPPKAKESINKGDTKVHFITRPEAKKISHALSSNRDLGYYLPRTKQIFIFPDKAAVFTTNIDPDTMKSHGYDDEFINKLKKKEGAESWKNVVTHELSHAAALNDNNNYQQQWNQEVNDVLRAEKNSGAITREDYKNVFISDYAMTNSTEDFAETAAFYARDKEFVDKELGMGDKSFMHQMLRKKFEFLRDKIWT